MRRRADARWPSVVLHVWVLGSLVGAAVVLLGTDDLDNIVVVAVSVSVVGPTVAWVATRRAEKERERAVRTALREHRDPGPELRSRVDEAARRILTTSLRTRWLMGLSITGVAGTCLWLALQRGDVVAALPAASLAALGVLADMGWRQERGEAVRWLEDPPVPVAADD